jgi:hypothetical protein
MSNAIKVAYNEGMYQALVDAGLVKEANIEQVRKFVKDGMSVEEAWTKAYPGKPVPPNIKELLEE